MSSDDTRIALAASYYHDGRYSAAKGILSDIPCDTRLKDLARMADVTFCRVMSMTKNKFHQETKPLDLEEQDKLWDEAKDAQVQYRSELINDFRENSVHLSGKEKHEMVMEYVPCLIMCAVKEVHLSLKMGDLDQSFISLSNLLRCAAEWLDGEIVMSLNEALMRIENSPLSESTISHHREAIEQLKHTLRVIDLVRENLNEQDFSCHRKRSRTESKMNIFTINGVSDEIYNDTYRISKETTAIHHMVDILHRMKRKPNISVNNEIYALNKSEPSNFLVKRISTLLSAHLHLHLPEKDRNEAMKISKLLLSLAKQDINASQVLACLYAAENRYDIALKWFYQSMKLCRNQGGSSKCREDITHNLAVCFLANGDEEAALELLLDLLNEDNVSSGRSSKYNPIQISILHGRISKVVSSKYGLILDSKAIKWHVFKCASVACDWKVCETITSRLMTNDGENEPEAVLAHAFSLLQQHSPYDAIEILESLKNTSEELTSLVLLGRNTYFSDALMSTDKFFDDITDFHTHITKSETSFKETFKPMLKDRNLMISCDEIKILGMNNFAVLQVIQGYTLNAMTILKDCSLHDYQGVQPLKIHRSSFNLVLLLWKEDNCIEASELWLRYRRKQNLLENTPKGIMEETKLFYQESISRYSMLRAKLNAETFTPKSLFRVFEDLSEIEIAAMDVLVLNFLVRSNRNKS